MVQPLRYCAGRGTGVDDGPAAERELGKFTGCRAAVDVGRNEMKSGMLGLSGFGGVPIVGRFSFLAEHQDLD